LTDGRYRKRLLETDADFESYCMDQNDLSVNENTCNIDYCTIFNHNQVSTLELEIGCGNGHFIFEKALKNPEVCYLANEIKIPIIKKAALKIHKNKLSNVFFLRGDIHFFLKRFADLSFNCVYINFPDPWPKKRHIKRRLINQNFLDIIYSKLKINGSLFFVSDSKNYIDYSINQFIIFRKFVPGIENFGFTNELPDYPQSLFESVFRRQNIPIYYTFYYKK